MAEVRRVAFRARTLLQTEGIYGLLAGVARWSGVRRRRLFAWTDYDIIEYDLRSPVPVPEPPPIPGLEAFVLKSSADVVDLVARDYEDFRLLDPGYDKYFTRDLVAFAVYVDRRLAHIGWVACSPEGKALLDALPYEVDFAHGQAVTGGAFTARPFRGRGIHRYVVRLKLHYLKERGWTSCRSAVGVRNTASQRTHRPLGGCRVCCGRHVRLLGLRRWTVRAGKTVTKEVPDAGPCERTV